MLLPLFAKGLAVGFCIAAPVGPIGLLCLRRSLADGRWIGFLSGLGAATADAIYGAVAAFGLTAVSDLLTAKQSWLRLGGGLFLVWLGLKTWRAQPPEQASAATAGTGLGAFGSTVLLTLTNPMTILSFVGVFAGLGLGAAAGNAGAAAALVAGVFLGSAAWWLILSGLAGTLRDRITPAWMHRVNQLSGALIAAFGAWQLVSLLH